jgi:hypothetical protein
MSTFARMGPGRAQRPVVSSPVTGRTRVRWGRVAFVAGCLAAWGVIITILTLSF